MSLLQTSKLLASLSPLGRSWAARVNVQDDMVTGKQPFVVRTFRPEGIARRAILIAPGVQPFETDDERMNGFARQLAAAGFLVCVPFLPTHLKMRMERSAIAEFIEAYDYLCSLPDYAKLESTVVPLVFSVSIGSFIATGLASRRPASELFVFGGFLRWTDLIRHALDGKADPLLGPVVFTNLVEFIEPGHASELRAAWLQFVRSTWRSPQKFELEFRRSQAAVAASCLPAELVPLFEIGCGVRPGALELGMKALEKGQTELADIDASRAVSRLEIPTHIIHGRTDAVIPVDQAHALYATLPVQARAGLYISRFYGHSKSAETKSLLRQPTELGRDVSTHLRMMHALANA